MGSNYELDDIEITQTSSLMEQIQVHVKKLRALQWAMIEAEEAFKKAETAYNDYSRNILPDVFKLNGLNELKLDDGSKVSVVTKTQCSINKNDSDRANVVKWLREHDGDSLVSAECIVPVSQKESLQKNSIIYEEKTSVNTNSVKAFIMDQLGQRGNPATIDIEDLPKGLNFFQYDIIEITR